MERSFFKRIISLTLSVALVVCCAGLSLSSAYAEGIEPSERITESSWDMSVPQIYVFTEQGNGTALQKEDDYQNADIIIKNTNGSSLSDSVQFKVRGNTTALSWVTKKAYTFKFDKKKNVLGLGSGKKWALIANAFDPTLLRNHVAFDLADELGLAYTSNKKVVELWVDNSFRGCYMLFEPVQQGADRVDIDIKSNGGKKDFLIEYEKAREEEDVTYFTAGNLRFIASEPEEPDEEQLAYIKDTVQGIINTLRTGVREDIEQAIDIDSFAKFYILNEYMKTFDFSMSSVFYYYKDGKLYAGPAWDYDLSSGNASPDYSARAANTHDPEGYMAKGGNIYYYITRYDWFYDVVREVYREHYDFIENIGADGGLIDTLYATYQNEITRNYSQAGWRPSRWWINNQLKPYATYQANFDFFKSWCADRNEWLKNEWELFSHYYYIGDADGNGRLSISDVTKIQRVIAELAPLSDELLRRADVDGDGNLTISDATEIQRFLVEFEVDYDIGSKIYI